VKTRRVEAAAGDAEQQKLRATALVPFAIIGLHRVAYGSKAAEFSIETPIALIEADLFEPEGREAFIQPRSVRCKYSGEWKRTTRLDRAFAGRVLDALRAQASTAREKRAEREPQSVEPSETLIASERRFDDAFADLEGEDGAT
jgi:hypothetical protein